jgi:RNA polymerase sigma factor (sigma-70 family)
MGQESTPTPASLESTARLLVRIRQGDDAARDRLLGRYKPILERWMEGKIPAACRNLLDTSDLVQMSLIRSLKALKSFEPKHEGAFLAYLRRISMNLIRDEMRRIKHLPEVVSLHSDILADGPSPLEAAIGSELRQDYEAALSRLPMAQQEALVMSLEFGCSPAEIAIATGRASANAARMYVARALVRLGEEMKIHG